MDAYSAEQVQNFIQLYKGNLVPLYTILASMTWVYTDWFMTIENEIKYIWPHKRNFGRFMYYWVRYYTLVLLTFDGLQIHLFTRPGIATNASCVAMDPITRLAGAVGLWSVEVIMQFRVYALYRCSKSVAVVNFILFLASIGTFLWILICDARLRSSLIATAVRLPLPGCPDINGSSMAWALWIPATAYEIILFSFALYKTISMLLRQKYMPKEARTKFILEKVLIHDNLLYFFAIASLLIFNNLMVVGKTHIPWFSFGPFHASVGILTGRMLVHLQKVSLREIPLGTMTLDRLEWAHSTELSVEGTSQGAHTEGNAHFTVSRG